MNPESITDPGLAAAMACLGFDLLTTDTSTFKGETEYIFGTDQTSENFVESVRSYCEGTLKVRALDYHRYLQSLIYDGR